jgi:hypothetical protein
MPDGQNQMLLAFFDSEGLISVHIMPRGASINVIYIIKVLGNFKKWLKNKRPVLVDHAGRVFHWDKEPVRTASAGF